MQGHAVECRIYAEDARAAVIGHAASHRQASDGERRVAPADHPPESSGRQDGLIRATARDLEVRAHLQRHVVHTLAERVADDSRLGLQQRRLRLRPAEVTAVRGGAVGAALDHPHALHLCGHHTPRMGAVDASK